MIKRYTFSPKNWLRRCLAILLVVNFSFNVQAQTAPNILWDKTIGGSNGEALSSLQQTSDGGYILISSSWSPISGDKTQASKGGYDYWIIKLDANGNKIWDRTFGGNEEDFPTYIQQTSDGGYILGGYSVSGISGDKSQAAKGQQDYWIVKLDNNGNKLWDKTFGGSGEDDLSLVLQTTDGGYILGGSSNSGIGADKSQISKGDYDYWVVKLDANGNKLWDKTFGGSNYEFLNSLQQTLDGGYILGGNSVSGISGDKTQPSYQGSSDYWILKLDAGGNKLWDKTFGGNSTEGLSSIQQTIDGGYFLGGGSWSGISGDKSQASQGGYDYWVVKLNALGNKTWDKTFGGNDDDLFISSQQTSDGGYILSGYSDSNISGDKSQNSKGTYDYWVIKLNNNGNKIWDKTLGGNNDVLFCFIKQTSDSGYIMGGVSESGISGDKTQASKGSYDIWMVKLAGNLTG